MWCISLTCLLGRNQSFQDTPPNLFVNFLSYTTFDHNSHERANARKIVADHLLHDVNHAESASPFDEVMLNTDFNLGYSGKDVLSILALKKQINSLQTSMGRHFICVETNAELLAAKKANMLPVKLFLKGSGGEASEDDLQSMREDDPSLHDKVVGYMEGQAHYSFNKTPFVKFLALLVKLSSATTPNPSSTQIVRALPARKANALHSQTAPGVPPSSPTIDEAPEYPPGGIASSTNDV
jgi:hypothetical protein